MSVVGTDFDDARLETLRKKAEPLAKANGVVAAAGQHADRRRSTEKFTYFALMAPIGALVAGAIQDADAGAIINIFAGIPAPTKHALDLDAYIEKRCFMFGTSGSTIDDMRIVLRKVERDGFDTNASVDAISGMAGAIDGIASVENRTLAGKIIVYPMLHDVGLIPLGELARHFPTVAAKLDGGKWTRDGGAGTAARRRQPAALCNDADDDGLPSVLSSGSPTIARHNPLAPQVYRILLALRRARMLTRFPASRFALSRLKQGSHILATLFVHSVASPREIPM